MTGNNNGESDQTSDDMTANLGIGDRPTSDVQIVLNPESAPCDSLDLLCTQLGNDFTPLGNSSRTNPECPSNVRTRLEVIEGGLLKHAKHLTTVYFQTQPQSKRPLLTLVEMELVTLEDRLRDAMKVAKVSRSDLARECGVSPAAVTKWLKGGKMSADNLAKSARAVGVRDEWLRTGKLPRDREHAQEERDIDRVMMLLSEVLGPLTSLVSAIQQITKGHSADKKRAGS